MVAMGEESSLYLFNYPSIFAVRMLRSHPLHLRRLGKEFLLEGGALGRAEGCRAVGIPEAFVEGGDVVD